MHEPTVTTGTVIAFLTSEGFEKTGRAPFSRLDRWKKPGSFIPAVFLPPDPAEELTVYQVRSLFRNKQLSDKLVAALF